MNERFSAGTNATVTAFHQMPVAGPEGELHSHDYQIEVVVESPSLDEDGMVVDLAVLGEELRKLLGSLEGSDLEAIRPPDAEAVTVEVFARWIHARLTERLPLSAKHGVSVRVWESDSEFGGYSTLPL
jgi:6-pyruvoyltetrahydropterin/6-carboxytetrahydropterin synthase